LDSISGIISGDYYIISKKARKYNQEMASKEVTEAEEFRGDPLKFM